MMALVGTISFNFQVLLPLLADFTWHGTASTYALLDRGDGRRLGGRRVGRGRAGPGVAAGCSSWPRRCSASFLALAAVAPTLELQVLALVPLGAASVTFAAGVNSTLQVAVEPVMRGRVMALYSIVFLGSTPIGAPLVGLAGRGRRTASRFVGGRRGLSRRRRGRCRRVPARREVSSPGR